MLAAWQVLSEMRLLARRPAVDPRLLWATAGLIGVLLLGALIIWWVDRWRKRSQETDDSSGDQLAHFRELYEQGALSPEEFQRIRGLLGERLRQQLELPQTQSPESAPQEAKGPRSESPAPPPPETPDGGIPPSKLQ